MLPPTLGAKSVYTLLDTAQREVLRSICAEDYTLLEPDWNPTPDLVRASNRALGERPGSREQELLWSSMVPQSGDFRDCGVRLDLH